MNLADQGHFVNLIPPIDISGGVESDIFSMKEWRHASILVQIGVSAGAPTKIVLYECDDVTPSNQTAIAHYIYKEETASGDTLGSRTAVTSAGTSPSANDNIMYVIELDADELTDGYPYVQLKITNAVQSVIASATAILTGGRYRDRTKTVLT